MLIRQKVDALLTWMVSRLDGQKYFNFTVADTVCQSYVYQCSKNPGAAAETREVQKSSKYRELANDYCFVPIGVETFGSWGPEGLKLIKAIGQKVKEATGERRSTFFLSQSISIAIQRGNASCVLGTVVEGCCEKPTRWASRTCPRDLFDTAYAP